MDANDIVRTETRSGASAVRHALATAGDTTSERAAPGDLVSGRVPADGETSGRAVAGDIRPEVGGSDRVPSGRKTADRRTPDHALVDHVTAGRMTSDGGTPDHALVDHVTAGRMTSDGGTPDHALVNHLTAGRMTSDRPSRPARAMQSAGTSQSDGSSRRAATAQRAEASQSAASQPARTAQPAQDARTSRRTPRLGSRPTRRQVVVASVAVALAVVAAVTVVLLTRTAPVEEVPLTHAVAAIETGDVTAATVRDAAGVVALTLTDGERVDSRFPAAYAAELTERLLAADVAVVVESGERPLWRDLATNVIPLLIILGIVVWVVKRANPNGMFGGTQKKALTSGEVPGVTFADVAGADEAVDQLREMVTFLREPDRFTAVGASRPRGALLVGPPGTGKTLLARAVAGEAGVPFFALAGSDFVETFVGVGARRVRDLFAEARKAGRAIIFIDEIDAVGRARSGAQGGTGGDGERENTLISLLNEMDGFAGSEVVVLAATNRPDILDPALTRPGRLDRQVQVPNPDRRGRTLILQVHAKGRPVADDVDFVTLARQTPGMSGADLASVVNEACMEAARRDQAVVDASCFQAAVATVAMGRARTSALVTDHDRRITAWHEAGHTIAAALLPDADDPVSVTIVPRGPAGGLTWMSGNDDVFLPRRKALAQLVVAMAGRAAEERLLGGEHTQGAVGDLQHATDLATNMVTKYGMTEFGYAQVDDDTLRVGGVVAAEAHAQVDALLREAHAQATALLAENSAALERVAAALEVEETLSGGRVKQLLAEADAVAA